MDAGQQPPEIFDRRRRRALRQRAAALAGNAFIWQRIADDLADRLAVVSRSFTDVLLLGPIGKFAEDILGSRDCRITRAGLSSSEAEDSSLLVEEDRLPFAPASFDLIISAGTLDSVNDLPGALIQIRRALRPDGLFLGHMFGAGTLATLKSAMLAAQGDAASPHFHPQIDLRAGADLLARAGSALPVADLDIMPVRYRDWRTLVADLREMGTGNALAGKRRFPGRSIGAALDDEWHARSIDGSVEERFVHLNLSGWSPSPGQNQPAQRGSGQVSLASILPDRKSVT